MPTDALTLLVAALALAAGGFVKGVVGIALPIVALAGLTSVLPVPVALALLVGPILATNMWQAAHAGNLREPLVRFWPMIVCLLAAIWFSAKLVAALDSSVLYAIIGVIVVLFSATAQFKPAWRVAPSAERWVGPLAGALGGFLGGVSTVWGPPMVMYFVSLNLDKDAFIRTVGLVWFCASIPLVLAYWRHGILTPDRAVWSAVGCVPAFAGLAAGQWLRGRIDQALFRRVLLIVLLLIGLNLVRRAIWG